MNTKIPKEKTKCPKNNSGNVWPIPAKVVAKLIGCSENMVRAIRRGDRNGETELGARIEVADMLLQDGTNKLLEQVKRLVKF